MMLKLQKRLAANVMRCSPKRVAFDPARLEDIKEAITKTDIRLLVGEGAIREVPEKGVSRVRANKRLVQRRKGLRKGAGSRKGKSTARHARKDAWMSKVRAQRNFIKEIKPILKPGAFKELYKKSKGGFFRSVKHIKLYTAEHKLFAMPMKVSRPSEGKTTRQEQAGEKPNQQPKQSSQRKSSPKPRRAGKKETKAREPTTKN
ncbi:50S ribosomal protein L19e [Candidatus Woesearchaeota archaeon]|nr:50S ribosomal protein L19e [Candidatus Woesearchaeota archaeon]